MSIITENTDYVNRIASKHDANFPHVEVFNLTLIDQRSVKATCSIRVGDLAITDVKVIVPALASRAFVAMPSRKVGDDWQSIVTVFDPILQERIADTVIAAWQQAQRGGVR